jgi:hypothetical protein
VVCPCSGRIALAILFKRSGDGEKGTKALDNITLSDRGNVSFTPFFKSNAGLLDTRAKPEQVCEQPWIKPRRSGSVATLFGKAALNSLQSCREAIAPTQEPRETRVLVINFCSRVEMRGTF